MKPSVLDAWKLEEAHFMSENEDCMGNPTPSYWRAWGTHSAMGSQATQIGVGPSKEEAESNLRSKVVKYCQSLQEVM